MRAIEAASDALYRGSVPETTPEQRRADALMFLVERAMEVALVEGADVEPQREDGRIGHPRGRSTGATSTSRRGPGQPEASRRESQNGGSKKASGEIDDVSAETPLCNDPSGSPGGGEASKSGILGTATNEEVIEPATQSSSGSSTTRIPLSERYTVILHVDADSLRLESEPGTAYLEDGTRVSAETARRIACDAGVVRVHEARAGQQREVEGKRRTVPMRLRRALEIRDRGCRFPGCGSRFTQAHHIQHWADGGATRLANLVSLCAQHHRLLHEGGFELEPDPTRPDQPIFYSPRGIRIPEAPPRITLDGVSLGGGAKKGGGKAGRLRVPRWEEDVPLAFYLRALEAMS
jgi:hypothetical protein